MACPSVSVGTAGFEPAFSCVRGTRPFRAGPRPESADRTSRISSSTTVRLPFRHGSVESSRRDSNPHALAGTRFTAGDVCMLLPLGTVARAPSGSRTRTSAMARQQAAATSWVLASVAGLSKIRSTKKARGRVTPGLQGACPEKDQESDPERINGQRRGRATGLFRHEHPTILMNSTKGHRSLPLQFESPKDRRVKRRVLRRTCGRRCSREKVQRFCKILSEILLDQFTLMVSRKNQAAILGEWKVRVPGNLPQVAFALFTQG